MVAITEALGPFNFLTSAIAAAGTAGLIAKRGSRNQSECQAILDLSIEAMKKAFDEAEPIE